MKSFQDYFSQFDADIVSKLQAIRTEIKKEIPDSEECIKYLMPTVVYQNKNLIHFAVFKNHIGLYPGPEAVNFFEKELAGYKTSKGAIQIPLEEAVPVALIQKIVQYIAQTTKTTNK